jgi:hypothetical protein
VLRQVPKKKEAKKPAKKPKVLKLPARRGTLPDTCARCSPYHRDGMQVEESEEEGEEEEEEEKPAPKGAKKATAAADEDDDGLGAEEGDIKLWHGRETLWPGTDDSACQPPLLRRCRDCSAAFLFSVGEQEFYVQKGFEGQPVRCVPTRSEYHRTK